MPSAKDIIVLIAAVIGAALAGTLVFSIVDLVSYEVTTSNSFYLSDIAAALYVWLVAAMVGVPVALLCGVPAYFLLHRLGLFKWWSVSIVGFVLGLLVHLTGVDHLPAVTCAAIGAVSAMIAWLLLKNSNYSSKRTHIPRAA